MKYVLLTAFALLLAACATGPGQLTASQCDADWGGVGQADGLEGASPDKLDRYRSACAETGAALSAADEAAWRDGRRAGLATYCAAPSTELSDDELTRRAELCPVRVAAVEPVYGGGASPRYEDRGYGYPRISPQIGVGVGSGGVSVGAGVGIDFGFLTLGIGF